MQFNVLSLFPKQISDFLDISIIGRAQDNSVIELNTIDIRDFVNSEDKYRKVDDTMFGGGTGMLMMCEPVYRAYESVKRQNPETYTIFVGPKGHKLNQDKVHELALKSSLTIICGHYEGIDSRVLDEIVDEEISIGDYVLTGGELAACVIIDSVSRMIGGVLPNEEAYTNESHMNGTLEAPQYTKPQEWHGHKVPEILLSGNSAEITEYNEIYSLYETLIRRPDMFDKLEISKTKMQKLLAFMRSL